jgi:hypothetical protein
MRPLVYLGVAIVAIREIYQIFSHRSPDRQRLQFSGIFSLLILLATSALLYFEVPARLYFFTADKQFQQVLAQQVLIGKDDRDIKKIGNFKISDIVVDSNGLENNQAKSVYFVTRNVNNWIDTDRYGFAYLPDRSKTFATRTTHLDGKWYIFFHQGD